VAKTLEEGAHRETASSSCKVPHWSEQLPIFIIACLKGRCLRERYKHSVIHSAKLQFTAKAIRLKTLYRLYPKELEPRRCPNSQKCLLLTKEPASPTGCDNSKVLDIKHAQSYLFPFSNLKYVGCYFFKYSLSVLES